MNLNKIAIILVTVIMSQQQQVAMTRYRGQQIVEIMRNASGQLANRLHFLTLYELCFKRL